MFAWTRGLSARAGFDNNEALANFSSTLERSIIETVEAGGMTKDLAILVKGTNKPERADYLNTFEFIDKVAETLRANLAK